MHCIHLNRICYRRFYNNMAFFIRMLISICHPEQHFIRTLSIVQKFLVRSIYVAELGDNTACFGMSTFFRYKRKYTNLRMRVANFLHRMTEPVVLFDNMRTVIRLKIRFRFCIQFFQTGKIVHILLCKISIQIFSLQNNLVICHFFPPSILRRSATAPIYCIIALY